MPIIQRLELRNEATSWISANSAKAVESDDDAEDEGLYEEIEFSNHVVFKEQTILELYESIFFDNLTQLDQDACDILAGSKLSDLGNVEEEVSSVLYDFGMKVTFNLADETLDEQPDSDGEGSYRRRQTSLDGTLMTRRTSCVSILSVKEGYRRNRQVPKLSSLCATVLANNVRFQLYPKILFVNRSLNYLIIDSSNILYICILHICRVSSLTKIIERS